MSHEQVGQRHRIKQPQRAPLGIIDCTVYFWACHSCSERRIASEIYWPKATWLSLRRITFPSRDETRGLTLEIRDVVYHNTPIFNNYTIYHSQPAHSVTTQPV